MNFRYLLLVAVLGLSACNGSDSSNTTTDSTFSDLDSAKKRLGDLNTQIAAGLDALADNTQKLDLIKDQRTAEEKRRDDLKAANDAAVVAAERRLGQLTEAANNKKAELKKAQDDYNALVGEDGTSATSGKIFEQTTRLAGLNTDVDTRKSDLKDAEDNLDLLLGKDRKGETEGKIFDARKELDDLIRNKPGDLGKIAAKQAELETLKSDVAIEEGKLTTARNELDRLLGADRTGTTAGEISGQTLPVPAIGLSTLKRSGMPAARPQSLQSCWSLRLRSGHFSSKNSWPIP
jgi:chromosome segregation ATPase